MLIEVMHNIRSTVYICFLVVQKVKRGGTYTAETRRFMESFVLVFFYSFLNESFEINIENEGHHVSIFELIKFKNILGFVTVSVGATVCTEAKSVFETLVFFFHLSVIY